MLCIKRSPNQQNADLQLKSLFAATESKIHEGFTTGSPPLKDLYGSYQGHKSHSVVFSSFKL